jgi:transketolase
LLSQTALIPVLSNIATRLRIDSIRSTTEAGSGHPSTCCSAAEIVSALFFAEMRFDPKDPQRASNDRFVLSKGHAAPILYAAWAEAGALDRSSLMNLRKIDSPLEGHPVPRLPFVDVATGSLGQGLCAGVGIALNARRIGSDYRTYVLMGDGECAEGSVWEAAQTAAHYSLDNLCAVTDVNALGQSAPTMWRHDTNPLLRRWEAFGWHVIVVNGHDLGELLDALEKARGITGRPTMILATTTKGKGVSFLEGMDGWHGRPLKKGDELERAIAELDAQFVHEPEPVGGGSPALVGTPRPLPKATPVSPESPPPSYELGDKVATREAYGTAIEKLGAIDPRVMALDADVKNSTFSERFEKKFPDRFVQCFIAEQAMLGAAMGLASQGAIPFPSSFACFLTRAYDFIRMTAISNLNVKMCGSHAGVSIGEDGPSQMGLEDFAMMRAQPNVVVLHPCDAVSAERLVFAMAAHPGPAYMRTARPKTPVIYTAEDKFEIGGSRLLRSSPDDSVTIVAVGVTVFEALSACERLEKAGIKARLIDAYSIQPLDAVTIRAAARETAGRIVTVEDHYASGGLGGAVAAAVAADGFEVHRLAVREIPRSGTPEQLLDMVGISARSIAETVERIVQKGVG